MLCTNVHLYLITAQDKVCQDTHEIEMPQLKLQQLVFLAIFHKTLSFYISLTVISRGKSTCNEPLEIGSQVVFPLTVIAEKHSIVFNIQ